MNVLIFRKKAKEMTKDQSRDTGMAMVLLLLLVYIRTRRDGFLWWALILHVLNMIVPKLYAPLAVVWLGLSHVLGTVMSKILLSILFFGVITPIGILRRLFGKDSLKLRGFKASKDSALVVRNHVFEGQDIEKPY
jgi:Saxitoxin biosynthesis operon protein SxtJ